MRVKFTNPLMYRESFDGKMVINNFFKGNKILVGQVKQVVDEYFLEVECFNEIGKPVKYVINPNSDYNFRFIPNAEADRKYAEALNRKVDELDAEPEFDSAGFSIADRFEDTEEDTHHCDDPSCNCSI